MGYLVYNDYAVSIQDFAFKQWIASNDLLRLQAEPRAQAKIKEYLVQKYDLATEFADTKIYANNIIYKANALIQLNYSAWALGNYAAGQFVSYTNGNVYRCILNTTASQIPTDTTYWILIGPQLGLLYLQYPYPVFNAKQIYAIGDRVYWQGKIYQCQIATILPSHLTELQDITYANIAPINVFPNDKINGTTNWGVGVDYSVTGIYPNFVATQGTWSGLTTYNPGDTVVYNGVLWRALLLNTDKIPGDDITSWQSITWASGDNRNQSIVDAYVSLVLWFLSPRIAPKVIPQWVQAKYEAAMRWLQDGAEGTITLDVPELQPSQGKRIRWGGQVKQNNSWN
jgi:hypothetical protein